MTHEYIIRIGFDDTRPLYYEGHDVDRGPGRRAQVRLTSADWQACKFRSQLEAEGVAKGLGFSDFMILTRSIGAWGTA